MRGDGGALVFDGILIELESSREGVALQLDTIHIEASLGEVVKVMTDGCQQIQNRWVLVRDRAHTLVTVLIVMGLSTVVVVESDVLYGYSTMKILPIWSATIVP